MKSRTLILLAGFCVALAMFVWLRLKREPAGPPPEIGARVLQVADINAISRVEMLSGTQQIALVRSETGWVVENRWNFPARFDQLAALLRDLDQLRVVEIIRGGSEILSEVGLVEDGTNFPVRIKLYAGEEKPADEIHIGKPRTSTVMTAGFQLPDSRYMRRARGPVVLASPFLQDISRRPADWIRAKVLDIREADIYRVMAVPSNDVMYAVTRNAAGEYEGVNALQDQRINAPSADLWFRAFQGVVIRDVVDPSTPRSALGQEEAELAAAYLTNGLVVRVELGTRNEEEYVRYGWFSFEYEGPSEEDESFGEANSAARKEAERLNREIAPWTYAFDFSQANKFIFLRDQLVAAPEPASNP